RGDVPVVVGGRHVAGVVVAAAHRLGVAFGVVQVAGHQPERPAAEVEADLAVLARIPGDWVHQNDRVAGQRAAHRAWLDLLARAVADLRGGLGLPEAVPDGDPPGLADLLADLRVQRLACRDALAQ